MTDWQALHRAVVEELDSDEPRLVLADALQAVGDPRGELIALQCELARLGASRTRLARWAAGSALGDWLGDAFETGDRAHRRTLRDLTEHLLQTHGNAWFPGLGYYRVERGFVEHVNVDGMPPHQLFDIAPTIASLIIDLDDDGVDETWLADPRMAQLRQLRIYLGGTASARAAALHVIERARHLRELAYSYLDDTIAFHDAFPRNVLATLEAVGFDATSYRVPAAYLRQLVDLAPHLRHLDVAGSLPIPWQALTGRIDLLELAYSVEEVSSIPRYLPGLRALRMREPYNNERFETGARALGEGLPSLRVLDLYATPFGRYLQDFVAGGGLASLTHLRLANCWVSDGALAYLIGSPLGHRLEYLCVTDNQLTDRSVDALGELGALRTLELSTRGFSRAALARLRERLPNTEIL